MTKRKIEERIKEHKKDIEFNRCTTALSQKNKTENIVINFDHATKIAEYNNRNYAIKRETIEIALNPTSVNLVEHSQLNPRWRAIINSAHAPRDRRERRGPDATTNEVNPEEGR